MKYLQILSARQNNLKGFNLSLPLYHLTVVTGVSGAGKSSLVFDTLYAEGQRRYLETFSTYLRQFLERLPRPRVKEILNIPPALAFPQGNFIRTSRSTVGTLTEISTFVKMLFYQSATPFCPLCKVPVLSLDPSLMADEALRRFAQQRILVLAPVKREHSPEYLKQGLLAEGFSRVFISGKICELEEVEALPEVVEVVIHRLVADPSRKSELISSLELALKISDRVKIQTLYGEELIFSFREECPRCGFTFPKKTPALFSFNTAQGACPECKGFGNLLVVDLEALVKHPELSLLSGAIPFLDYPALQEVKQDLFSYLRERGLPLNVPFSQYSEEVKRKIFHGDRAWYGLKEVVDWLYAQRYKPHIRILLAKLRREVPCPKCQGTRFNPQALLFRLKELTIGDFYSLEVKELISFLEGWLKRGLAKAEERIGKEVLKRLRYLEKVGLAYLTLGRASKTLSGGEVSRCLLTRALSSDLTETLYLIDEPTTGLHPRDTQKVLHFMENLVQKNNTVVVVEHDPEVILSAQFLVELGPEGGEGGGHLLYADQPEGILGRDTPTGKALVSLWQGEVPGRKKIKEEKTSPSNKTHKFLTLRSCRGNNLKGFTLTIPLNTLTVIAGVSGSGKSTLLEDVLERTFRQLKEGQSLTNCEVIEGLEYLGKDWEVYNLTQEGLARSPRAIVATYMGLYPFIRKLLASTEEAKALGFNEGYFSFNSPQTQCPNCKGLGYEVVELQFLSDLAIPCEICQGKRFREDVLEIKWRGKNIAEILELTVSEALSFFGSHREMKRILQILEKLGLSYLKLGQSLSTLSGGEAQRLKLAELLTRVKKGRALILLDEPTVGLHLQDVWRFLNIFSYLKEEGHTILIVEHHPEVILFADYVVELGPEGGEKGGHLLYQGPLTKFLSSGTPTAQYLQEYLRGKTFSSSKGKEVQPLRKEEAVIVLRGVRHHNLKNINLDIPRGKLVLFTGVSGSGKSTLVFDVIFTEGQRRFLETLPGYFRQFIKIHEEPEVDLISGLPPTVALEQRSGELSVRSTVGTLTEVLPYLRLLYAQVSEAYCPSCGKALSPRREEEILRLAEEISSKEAWEEAEVLVPLVRYRKGFFRPLFERYLKQGYHDFRVDGIRYTLPPFIELSRYKEHTIELILGKPQSRNHLLSLVELALREGKGEVILSLPEKEFYLSTKRTCLTCWESLPEPTPLLFSFNTKVGACSTCEGLGLVEGRPCPTCQGRRLRREVNYYKINSFSLPELCDLPIASLLSFFEGLKFSGKKKEIAEELRQEILSRLRCLVDLGLSYLTLSRSANTLSAGEAKRVRISAEIGSNLTGVAYILDEPTIGLHPRDTEKLIAKLRELTAKGNTLMVVEHDEETIRAADFVVDLGPGGGKRGGEVLFAGDKEAFLASNSLTAKAIRDPSRKRIGSYFRQPKEFLTLKGVKFRNLKDFDLSIPLGALVGVVGISGSGKSTLVCEVLYESLRALLEGKKKPFGVKAIENWERLSQVYLVDHSPIGNTPRSVPATYINVFTAIRKLFANTLLAKQRGYKEGRFSFNNEEGHCLHCKGHGQIKVEIPFLPTIYQTCEHCQGQRYNPETLEVKLHGKSIAEVLAMDFGLAREFLANHPEVLRKLDFVCQIGLDYLLLGQPSPTLSGGEAQRIKIAKELSKSPIGSVLYLLDEPTTGLHILDVEKLVLALQGLVDKGHTVIFIEHNLELIKHADWIIELGPEGGEKGGYLLFSGPMEEFLKAKTETAYYLRKYLS